MGGFGQLIDQFVGQIITIPLTNPLSYVYVVLNLLLLLVGPMLGQLWGGEDPEEG